MKKLTHNLGMKVIACFLVIISGFMMVGSGVGGLAYATTKKIKEIKENQSIDDEDDDDKK